LLTKPKLPTSEELLLDYARRLDRHREGRRALWLHLSRLARQNRHESNIRLAANLLRPLARRFQGEVFQLTSGDIVVCLKDPEERMIDSVLFDVRFSFAQDPLMKRVDAEGPDAYLTIYDIGRAHAAFAAAAARACAPGGSAPAAPERAEEELGTARLILSRAELRAKASAGPLPGHVETSQGRIAIERLLERQVIARLEGRHVARRWGWREHVRALALDAFEPLATAVARHQMTKGEAFAEIERLLLGGWADLLSTESTGRHLLLIRTETLISAEFLVFDRWLEDKRLDRPAIGFVAEDVLGDRETADYVRGFLRERGYRFGLADLSLADLAGAGAALSGMMFLEIAASGEISKEVASRLGRAIGELGAEAVLATGIATQASLDSVFKAGIRLVSGPAVRV